jgi:hypothetical protein
MHIAFVRHKLAVGSPGTKTRCARRLPPRIESGVSYATKEHRISRETMPRSLSDRIRAHEQRKARLAEEDAKLKLAERKARTRHLIQAGGLVDKAGLLDLDSNALYGALLSLRDGASNPEQVARWAALGGRAFAREAQHEDEGKEAVVLTFPQRLGREATNALRAAGFRFNRLLQHWEGRARPDAAEVAAAAYGGEVRRVAPTVPAEQHEAAAE